MATSTFSKFWTSGELKILDYNLPASGSVDLARTNSSQYVNFLMATYKNDSSAGASSFTLWWGYLGSASVRNMSRIDTNTATPHLTVALDSGKFVITNTSSTVSVGLRVWILGGGNLMFTPVTT